MGTVIRDDHGRIQAGAANPTGKGGFKEHPENARPELLKTKGSFKWNLNRFKLMTTKQLAEQRDQVDSMNAAELKAYKLILQMLKNDERSFDVFKDIADRTEGKARMSLDTTIDAAVQPIINVTFKGGDTGNEHE